jgi:hypothetical protein
MNITGGKNEAVCCWPGGAWKSQWLVVGDWWLDSLRAVVGVVLQLIGTPAGKQPFPRPESGTGQLQNRQRNKKQIAGNPPDFLLFSS